MSRVKQAVDKIKDAMRDSVILEVACGCAKFSIEASKIARSVFCIDLDSFRLRDNIKNISNVTFEQMDASSMTYKDDSFDAVVLYNAVAHIDTILEDVLSECLRVLKPGGSVFIISSFKIDKTSAKNHLIPYLKNAGLNYKMFEDNIFTYVEIEK